MNSKELQNKMLQAEVDRILAYFAANPEVKHRAILQVARRLILNGPYVMQGQYRDIKAKSLGAGVYELRTVKAIL